jgi:Tol biopolymer transport system component
MKPIRGGLLSAIGVAFMLLVLSPAISWATYPGANGRIAYEGWTGTEPPLEGEDTELFTILPNGSGLRQLTDDSSYERDPSWSADGRRLTYIDGGWDNRGVFTMRADGTHQRRLTLGDHIDPHFSPSGRRIVYVQGYYPGPGTIFTVRADGTGQRRFVARDAQSPVYAPEGGPRRIAFAPSENGFRRQGIWTVRRNGTHQRRVTHPDRGFRDEVVDWSPDGRQIAFTRCEYGTHRCYFTGLRAVRPDGSHEHDIGNPFTFAAYSPSGRRAVHVTGEGNGEQTLCLDIYTILLAGSGRRELTHNCEGYHNGGPVSLAYNPSWQPIPQP